MRTTASVTVVLAGLLLGVTLVATTATAIPVSGRLDIPRNFAPPHVESEGPAGYYWQERNGVIDARPPRVDVPREVAAVLLGDIENRPDSSFQIQGGNLLPSTLVVQAGSNLRIQNTDGCSHELFVLDMEAFAALQTAPGNARTVQLPGEASHFVIQDRIHPHVKAHVHIVTNLVARARLGDDGRFSFEDVPPGTYTLKVYYGELEVGSREIVVEDGRDLTIEEPLSLTLPASQ